MKIATLNLDDSLVNMKQSNLTLAAVVETVGGAEGDYTLHDVSSEQLVEAKAADFTLSTYDDQGDEFTFVAASVILPAHPYLSLFLTDASDVVLPDTDPMDGYGEIDADGVTTAKLKIQKKNAVDDSNMTDAGDTDTITVFGYGITLGSYSVDLVAGAAEVVITSRDVPDIYKIVAKADTMGQQEIYIQCK